MTPETDRFKKRFALKFIFSIDDQSRGVILFVRKSSDHEVNRTEWSTIANSSQEERDMAKKKATKKAAKKATKKAAKKKTTKKSKK